MSSKKRKFHSHAVITSVILFIFCSLSSFSQTTQWTIDSTHARIGFTIPHFGISETDGKFTRFDGVVLADKADFSDAQIEFKIDAGSINTENVPRDQHLRSADFFDVEKFPEISFKSKSISARSKNHFKVTGDLTMHGITKPVTLDAVYRGTVKDPFGNTKAGFKISGMINRKDWGLTWNTLLETGGLAVGENVTLNCDVELLKTVKQ